MKPARKHQWPWTAALGLILLGATNPASAADLNGLPPLQSAEVSNAPAARDWSFSFSTYGWLPWISGDLSVRGRPLTVEASPDQLIEALDWSTLPIWMSQAEARNGRFSLFNDIVYTKLSGSADFAKSVRGRFASLALGGRVEADYEQATIELGAGYEVWSSGDSSPANRSSLELIAGGRYWYQETDISADLKATLALTGPLGLIDLTRSGSRVLARSGSVDWIDPFVGMRMRYAIAPGQSVLLRGDIGGFGAGSDFTWQAIATYDWQMCLSDGYTLDAYLGYRALSVDYTEGAGSTRYEFDVIQHGPVMGLTVRF